MMNRILCPTDFSDRAVHALRFALGMAGDRGAEIVVFHCVTEAAVISGSKAEAVKDMMLGKDQDPLRYMEQYISNICGELGVDVPIRYAVTKGDPAEEINRIADSEDVDLVIIAPQGEREVEEKILDTVATDILRLIKRPVMVVPENAAYSPIHHIAYATDFEEKDFKVIDSLLVLAQLFQSKITCVHVRPDDEYWGHKQREMYERMYLIENTNNLVGLHIIRENDITRALMEFVEDQKVDVLAALTHHPDIMREVYRKSFSSKLALHSHVPFLAFHNLAD